MGENVLGYFAFSKEKWLENDRVFGTYSSLIFIILLQSINGELPVFM